MIDILFVQATSGSIPSAETSSSDVEEEVKSEIYSNNMTEAMGAGMFNHIVLLIYQQPNFIILLYGYLLNNDLSWLFLLTLSSVFYALLNRTLFHLM